MEQAQKRYIPFPINSHKVIYKGKLPLNPSYVEQYVIGGNLECRFVKTVLKNL